MQNPHPRVEEVTTVVEDRNMVHHSYIQYGQPQYQPQWYPALSIPGPQNAQMLNSQAQQAAYDPTRLQPAIPPYPYPPGCGPSLRPPEAVGPADAPPHRVAEPRTVPSTTLLPGQLPCLPPPVTNLAEAQHYRAAVHNTTITSGQMPCLPPPVTNLAEAQHYRAAVHNTTITSGQMPCLPAPVSNLAEAQHYRAAVQNTSLASGQLPCLPAPVTNLAEAQHYRAAVQNTSLASGQLPCLPAPVTNLAEAQHYRAAVQNTSLASGQLPCLPAPVTNLAEAQHYRAAVQNTSLASGQLPCLPAPVTNLAEAQHYRAAVQNTSLASGQLPCLPAPVTNLAEAQHYRAAVQNTSLASGQLPCLPAPVTNLAEAQHYPADVQRTVQGTTLLPGQLSTLPPPGSNLAEAQHYRADVQSSVYPTPHLMLPTNNIPQIPALEGTRPAGPIYNHPATMQPYRTDVQGSVYPPLHQVLPTTNYTQIPLNIPSYVGATAAGQAAVGPGVSQHYQTGGQSSVYPMLHQVLPTTNYTQYSNPALGQIAAGPSAVGPSAVGPTAGVVYRADEQSRVHNSLRLPVPLPTSGSQPRWRAPNQARQGAQDAFHRSPNASNREQNNSSQESNGIENANTDNSLLTKFIKKKGTLVAEGNLLDLNLRSLREARAEVSEAQKEGRSVPLRFTEEIKNLEIKTRDKLKSVKNDIMTLNNLILKYEKVSSSSSGTSQDKFDPNGHWCQDCNVFPLTVSDMLEHLRSPGHFEKTVSQGSAWHSKIPVDEDPPLFAPSVDLPLRGMQFLESATVYYCKLCDKIIRDEDTTIEHLKSVNHARSYLGLTRSTPSWENTWRLDRERAFNETQSNVTNNENKKENHPVQDPNTAESKGKKLDKKSLGYDAARAAEFIEAAEREQALEAAAAIEAAAGPAANRDSPVPGPSWRYDEPPRQPQNRSDNNAELSPSEEQNPVTSLRRELTAYLHTMQ
ncbi:uncharacterized protein LOC142986548 [Anticarsia gemmatalis]|uniref:uncharacterized protein LOC142986548 n=1 Tax=Anticarsia gemmatalis TaxID=129554 RepID=UPI003F7753E2